MMLAVKLNLTHADRQGIIQQIKNQTISDLHKYGILKCQQKNQQKNQPRKNPLL